MEIQKSISIQSFHQAFVKLFLVFALSFSALGYSYAGTDGDNVPDASDLDADNDGILNSQEGICTPPSTTLNSTGYGIDTPLQNTPGLPLTFFGGAVTLNAALTGTAGWTGGIRVKNNDGGGVVPDFIFVQPNGVNSYYAGVNTATYTFDFTDPVQNLVMVPGGLNNDDGTTVTAYIGGITGTPVSYTFSNLSAGMSIDTNDSAGDTVQSTSTTGGIEVLSNSYTLTIPGPVDTVVIETGKVDNNGGNVTLGFSGISWECISLDTDLDGTPDYLDTDADGDMCNDADEAYAAVDTDSNGDGTFGGVVGSGQVNGDGTVSAASYTAPATTGGETTFQEGITLSVDADPTQQAFIVGGTADFSATLSSATVLNDPTVSTSTAIDYQWQVSTDGGASFTDVVGGTNGSGTTSSGSTVTYTTPALAVADASNQYRIIATNVANICGDTSASADFNAPFADLAVTKTDASPTYTPGAAFSYTITIDNNGPDAADGALIADALPTWALTPAWSCSGTGGAECTSGSANTSGTGDLNETLGAFPNGGQVVYTITGTYSADMADYP